MAAQRSGARSRGPLFQRFAISRDCLIQPRGAVFKLAQGAQRIAQTVLSCSPIEWHPFTGLFF